MRYLTKNGELLEGNSLVQLFESLKKGSKFDSDLSDEDFMKSFAFRFKEFYGINISFDTIDLFMTDLIKYGFLTKIN